MIRIVLSHKPFDRIESPIASVPFFLDQRPLRSSTGLIDWRLNGRVSRLLEQGHLSGREGDSLLVPTEGRMMADNLLLFGMGASEDWEATPPESRFEPWIKKLAKLQHRTWLLSFSGLVDNFMSWRHCLRTFVHAMSNQADQPCRRLLLTEADPWVLEARKRNMDFGEQASLSFDLAG